MLLLGFNEDGWVFGVLEQTGGCAVRCADLVWRIIGTGYTMLDADVRPVNVLLSGFAEEGRLFRSTAADRATWWAPVRICMPIQVLGLCLSRLCGAWTVYLTRAGKRIVLWGQHTASSITTYKSIRGVS
eukprot:1177267-Rhodomonas_salina.1